jgi:hypothetical protein
MSRRTATADHLAACVLDLAVDHSCTAVAVENLDFADARATVA